MVQGRRIKNLRLARGLTQKELGEMIGLSDVRIRQYELEVRNELEVRIPRKKS